MQDRIESVETLWADLATPIRAAEDYINSLRGRRMNVFFMGERVPEPVDHPVIRPSINAMAETYRLATERPDLATVYSSISDRRINRFLHVPVNSSELVAKHEMQRELGRRTGTCFQRCVGLDAIGSCHSVTFDIDGKNSSEYHKRFLAFLERAQAANVVIGGAMTDP
jgi:4-hydroxybutyryl-CoA dehydratase / vinylacetyl-CoA-Delta-isomerase